MRLSAGFAGRKRMSSGSVERRVRKSRRRCIETRGVASMSKRVMLRQCETMHTSLAREEKLGRVARSRNACVSKLRRGWDARAFSRLNHEKRGVCIPRPLAAGSMGCHTSKTHQQDRTRNRLRPPQRSRNNFIEKAAARPPFTPPPDQDTSARSLRLSSRSRYHPS